MTELMDFAQSVAREAGELVVRERAQADLVISYKGGNELVTNADVKADRLIRTRIEQCFSEHRLLSEESSPELQRVWDSEVPVWIVDPIDGTVNYARGHIQSAVSIAYCENGQITLGVVYNPFTDELFSAELGKGALLNGVAIRVAQETTLRRAVIATGFPYIKEGIDEMVERVRSILHNCADIRRLGSAALDICWLAAGRLDGYYESLSLWDFAAARLIAEEAGAVCGHFGFVPKDADPQFFNKNLLIANPVLYPKLLALLRQP
tara:strand:+ start:796 stop:1590 length:795 start_codon:yes stop_codon:yes gene_type:complete